MRLSTYTRLVPLPGDRCLVLNLPHKNADIVPAKAAERLKRPLDEGPVDGWIPYALRVGYLTEASKEAEQQWFGEVVDALRSGVDAANVMIVTTNSCNLACSYCYQADTGVRSLSEKYLSMSDATSIMSHVRRIAQGRGVQQFELIGGEPLLPRLKDVVEFVVCEAEALGLPTRVTTNGVFLDVFEHLLSPTRINELQVSLDGTEEVHDRRRVPMSGKPTFSRIVEHIELALEKDVRVWIRPNVDKRNLQSIPGLMEFLQTRGILGHKRVTFDYMNVLPDPVSLDRGIGDHYLSRSEIDAFLVARGLPKRSLVFEGIPVHGDALESYLHYVMENPVVDGCGAPLRNLYFAPGQQLYNCHELVGRPEHAIGSFNRKSLPLYPVASAWRARTVDKLVNCRECSVALAHGGGCGARAASSDLGTWGVCDGFPDEFDNLLRALESGHLDDVDGVHLHGSTCAR